MANRVIASLQSASRQSRVVRLALAPAIAVKRIVSRRIRAIQQECYDRLRLQLVEDPVLAIKDCDGQFAMDVRSDVFKRLFFKGDYENSLMRLCRALIDPQRDALDVGANLGFFTVLMAKTLASTGRRVVSVEPTPNALRRLRANVERNGVSSAVTIFEGVASNEPGVLEFTVIVGKEEYSCLSGAKHPRISGAEGVEYSVEKQISPATTVDILTADHRLDPGFLKVDVEGAELMVFQGAQQTLRQFRPIVLSELSEKLMSKTGAAPADVLKIFHELDYVVLDPAELDSTTPQFIDEEMLCIPREKMAACAPLLKSLPT